MSDLPTQDHAHTNPTSQTDAPRPRSRWWSRHTLVQFGWMVGLGFTGPDIQEVMGCSSASVANACKRYGVKMHRRRNGDSLIPAVVNKPTRAAIDDAASIRGISRTELVERVLAVLGEEGPAFVDGVLDDGVTFDPEWDL